MRLQLIDGQGNFGSVDGDPPAAMRYTECRLAKPAMALLDDIDKDTVDFQANYDGNEREPVVLPARFPEFAGQRRRRHRRRHGHQHSAAQSRRGDRRLHGADRRSRASTIDDLIKIVPGPDFPTGGIILGRAGIHSAYHTGRGSVVMRGKVAFETIRKEREAIVITEIPYQVNKATMVERIAELVREKKIDGIADLRDESDRDGYRVVIELKRDAERDVVLNQLYRFTPLQSSFRRQHGGARRRPPAGDDAEGHARRLRRVPRGGGLAAHQVPAHQGARPRPRPGRPRHRGRQYRRGDQADPRLEGRQRGARGLDGARMAGHHGGDADRADRRSAPQSERQRHRAALGRAGQSHPRPAPAAADRARPRRDQGGARQARRRDRRLSRHPALARAHPGHHQGPNWRR